LKRRVLANKVEDLPFVADEVAYLCKSFSLSHQRNFKRKMIDQTARAIIENQRTIQTGFKIRATTVVTTANEANTIT